MNDLIFRFFCAKLIVSHIFCVYLSHSVTSQWFANIHEIN